MLGAIRRHLPAELHASVEDVAQETYLRYFLAFRSKPPLAGDDLHRWLYTAARNEASRAGRKQRRAGFSLLRFWQAGSREVFAQEDPEETADPQKLAQELPDKYRVPTLLRLSGLSLAEIAKRLNVAQGTVKSRLSRGRDLMRRMAANEGGAT